MRNPGYEVEAGEWREALARAYPIGDPTVASLRVSVFGPFYAGYHVIELDRRGDSRRGSSCGALP